MTQDQCCQFWRSTSEIICQHLYLCWSISFHSSMIFIHSRLGPHKIDYDDQMRGIGQMIPWRWSISLLNVVDIFLLRDMTRKMRDIRDRKIVRRWSSGQQRASANSFLASSASSFEKDVKSEKDRSKTMAQVDPFCTDHEKVSLSSGNRTLCVSSPECAWIPRVHLVAGKAGYFSNGFHIWTKDGVSCRNNISMKASWLIELW
jgi:hypothetical protein